MSRSPEGVSASCRLSPTGLTRAELGFPVPAPLRALAVSAMPTLSLSPQATGAVHTPQQQQQSLAATASTAGRAMPPCDATMRHVPAYRRMCPNLTGARHGSRLRLQPPPSQLPTHAASQHQVEVDAATQLHVRRRAGSGRRPQRLPRPPLLPRRQRRHRIAQQRGGLC